MRSFQLLDQLIWPQPRSHKLKMRLHLFFILLGLLYSSCSQLPSGNDEESVAESGSESESQSETSGFEISESYDAIYPQDVMILNQHNSCYINALLYSLYNIPFFQLSVLKLLLKFLKLNQMLLKAVWSLARFCLKLDAFSRNLEWILCLNVLIFLIPSSPRFPIKWPGKLVLSSVSWSFGIV